jgi:hypothetical protein
LGDFLWTGQTLAVNIRRPVPIYRVYEYRG